MWLGWVVGVVGLGEWVDDLFFFFWIEKKKEDTEGGICVGVAGWVLGHEDMGGGFCFCFWFWFCVCRYLVLCTVRRVLGGEWSECSVDLRVVSVSLLLCSCP